MIELVAVWPAARLWKVEPGLKLYEPSAFSVKVPPLEPVTAVPTLAALPLTCETVSVSPSGSVSLASTPFWAVTLSDVSSSVVPLSLTAVGAGLVTSHLNSCEVEAPDGSVAVTTTVYTPLAPPCEAEWSIVPVMMPVFGSIVRPGGRPVAE
ncbi:hypothetical protein LMG26685_04699 [Achromobacter mucicolens]|nr:hypothetical protein LMG26685_04699 [Achromobacter mucicolens]